MSAGSPALDLNAELWLRADGEALAGRRRIGLLAAIERLGSITHAAKAAGLSYKGAWDAVEHMSNLAGEPLLERSAGGRGGGSTRLTPRGAQLLERFRVVEEEHARFLERLNERADGLREDLPVLKGMAMKTSARNQFSGRVTAVRDGVVNDEVTLEAIGGLAIVATVTRESRKELGLEPGARAIALVKASSVVLVSDPGDAKFSARNRFDGVVARVSTGAVNSEIVLDLPGGGTVAAIVTLESERRLGLAVGRPATALFKVSSVVLAVPEG